MRPSPSGITVYIAVLDRPFLPPFHPFIKMMIIIIHSAEPQDSRLIAFLRINLFVFSVECECSQSSQASDGSVARSSLMMRSGVVELLI